MKILMLAMLLLSCSKAMLEAKYKPAKRALAASAEDEEDIEGSEGSQDGVAQSEDKRPTKRRRTDERVGINFSAINLKWSRIISDMTSEQITAWANLAFSKFLLSSDKIQELIATPRSERDPIMEEKLDEYKIIVSTLIRDFLNKEINEEQMNIISNIFFNTIGNQLMCPIGYYNADATLDNKECGAILLIEALVPVNKFTISKVRTLTERERLQLTLEGKPAIISKLELSEEDKQQLSKLGSLFEHLIPFPTKIQGKDNDTIINLKHIYTSADYGLKMFMKGWPPFL